MREQREAVDARLCDDDDAAAVAAVAAVGTAARDELLATKAHRSVAAFTGVNADGDAIDEHENTLLSERWANTRMLGNVALSRKATDHEINIAATRRGANMRSLATRLIRQAKRPTNFIAAESSVMNDPPGDL